MKFIHLAFICLVHSTLLNLLQAQEKVRTDASISIRMPAQSEGDTINLQVWEYYTGSSSQEKHISPMMMQGVVENGTISFRFPVKNRMQYFSLESDRIKYPLKSREILATDPVLYKYIKNNNLLKTSLYLIEPGDHLRAKLALGKLIFSGKGSGKWAYRADIDTRREEDDKYPKASGLRVNTKAIYDYIEYFRLTQSFQLSYLNQYRKNMSELAYQVLYADIIGKTISEQYRGGSFYFYLKNEYKEVEDSIVDIYAKMLYHQNRDFPSLISSEAKSYSAYFAPGLFKMLDADLSYESKVALYAMKGILLDTLFTNYKGLLRDKLLFRYATRSIEQSKDNQLALERELETIRKKISVAFYRYSVKKFSKQFSRGVDVENFAFTDSSGNIKTLADFKGKLVFVDMWFSGCGACVDVARGMPGVEEAFAGDSSLVLLSLSIDKDREKWIHSIRKNAIKNSTFPYSGQHYSGEETVYLYSAGKSENDNFIKIYGFRGYPSLLLIDKNGKLITNTPPRPSSNKLANDRFIQFLKKELARETEITMHK